MTNLDTSVDPVSPESHPASSESDPLLWEEALSPWPPNVPEILMEEWRRRYKPDEDGCVFVPISLVVNPKLDLKYGLIDDLEKDRPIIALVECAVYRNGRHIGISEGNPRDFPESKDLPVQVEDG